MFDDWQFIATVAAAVFIAYGIVLSLGIIVWTYRDIGERTRDGWSQAVSVMLVFLFNIPGLFLYLILRPRETLADTYERRLETEAIRQDLAEQRVACPNCQRPVKEEFLFCPHCRTKLQAPCAACGSALELSWATCPYCGAPGPQPAEITPALAPTGTEREAAGQDDGSRLTPAQPPNP